MFIRSEASRGSIHWSKEHKNKIESSARGHRGIYSIRILILLLSIF